MANYSGAFKWYNGKNPKNPSCPGFPPKPRNNPESADDLALEAVYAGDSAFRFVRDDPPVVRRFPLPVEKKAPHRGRHEVIEEIGRLEAGGHVDVAPDVSTPDGGEKSPGGSVLDQSASAVEQAVVGAGRRDDRCRLLTAQRIEPGDIERLCHCVISAADHDAAFGIAHGDLDTGTPARCRAGLDIRIRPHDNAGRVHRPNPRNAVSLHEQVVPSRRIVVEIVDVPVRARRGHYGRGDGDA